MTGSLARARWVQRSEATPRDRRDLVILALVYAGLTTQQIARLRVGDVRHRDDETTGLPVAVVRVPQDAAIREAAELFVRLRGELAAAVVDYLELQRVGAGRKDPLFVRRDGRALSRGAVLSIWSRRGKRTVAR